MKIQFELESSDVEEMLTTYFNARGFQVKNLKVLVDEFEKAYSLGLRIDVEPIVGSPRSPITGTTLPAPAPFETPGRPLEEDAGVPFEGEGTRRLSISDLMDPTPSERVPTRDELLRAEQQELDRILKQSRALIKEDKNV